MIDKYTAIILYVHVLTTMLPISLCLVSLNPPSTVNKHCALYTQVEDIECTKSKMRTVQFSSSLCTTIVTYTKEIKPPRIIYYIVRLLKKDKMKINIIFIIMLIQFFVNCLSVPVAKYMEGLGKFCGSKLAIELSILCKGKYNEARGNVNQRPKRGIVEECCLTSCTRKYIKDNYCGPESTEPNIKQTMEKTTASPNIKKNTKQKIDYFSVLFNLVWKVGEEFGMISIPSDHRRPK